MQIPKGTENSKFAADMRRLQVAMASVTPTSEVFAKAVKQLNKALSTTGKG
jgi:hypothetical protein